MAARSPVGTKTIAGHLYLSPQSILVPEEFLAAILATCFVLYYLAVPRVLLITWQDTTWIATWCFYFGNTQARVHVFCSGKKWQTPEDQGYNLYLGTLMLNVIFS